MLVLLGFLCCLANAATLEDSVPQTVLLVPVHGGVVLQSQVMWSEQGVRFLSGACVQPVPRRESVMSSSNMEEGEPCAKRRRVSREDSEESCADMGSVCLSDTPKDDEGEESASEEEEPVSVISELIRQVDEKAKHRQADILSYLFHRPNSFIPETDLQALHQQEAIGVLEDVMVLIAAQYCITYKDQQYRLGAFRPTLPVRTTHSPHALLCEWMRAAQYRAFQDLSAVEQAYYIYEQTCVYVPVSTVALWLEMQKEKNTRGLAEKRLRRVMYFANHILRTKTFLSIDEYCPERYGQAHTTDMALVRRSLNLYTQGRDALAKAEEQKELAPRILPDEQHPEIFECLNASPEQWISALTLKGLMKRVKTDHRHRTLCVVIATLRERGHNVRCSSYTQTPRGALRYSFALSPGLWKIKDGYKKALWDNLDDPEISSLGIADLFLALSNEHYAPSFSVIGEVMQLKNLAAGRAKCPPRVQESELWKLHKMWEVALQDREFNKKKGYYEEKLGTDSIPRPFFRKVRRSLSLYKEIHE